MNIVLENPIIVVRPTFQADYRGIIEDLKEELDDDTLCARVIFDGEESYIHIIGRGLSEANKITKKLNMVDDWEASIIATVIFECEQCHGAEAYDDEFHTCYKGE